MTEAPVEDLLRELAPQVLGAVARQCRDFGAAEDAVQEALLTAALQWPQEGVPAQPRGWLIRVASRRLTDHVRSETARQRREEAAAATWPQLAPAADAGPPDADDSLALLFLCCHPALTPPTAIGLTLRAVGGLSTAEIARAFLVPEATMAQRISRAKQTIKASGAAFTMPGPAEWPARLRSVLHVLYLIFNEGYARPDLAHEAIRLTRTLHTLLPADGEVAGLLALMLLTEARRPARTGPAGEIIPLDEQDRTRWHPPSIDEGVALVTAAMTAGNAGPYLLQAAIAACHDEAPTVAGTDWPQILALYGVLMRMSDNPMIALNRAVAAAMVHGPATGLGLVDGLADRLAGNHRLTAVRAHLLEMSGDRAAARAEYLAAARITPSRAERDYLTGKATRLSP
jgi:predicted RNA polymerase sigma factor